MAITISTWKHGIDATKTSIEILNNDGTAVDSVENGVKVTEADPKVRTVSYGGYTDDTGKVTVDASIMDHEGNAGSVAYLENIKHPISVARKVMELSRHVMLVGSGAYNFAIDNGFDHEVLLTNQSENDWKEWKFSCKECRTVYPGVPVIFANLRSQFRDLSDALYYIVKFCGSNLTEIHEMTGVPMFTLSEVKMKFEATVIEAKRLVTRNNKS